MKLVFFLVRLQSGFSDCRRTFYLIFKELSSKEKSNYIIEYFLDQPNSQHYSYYQLCMNAIMKKIFKK